MTLLLIYLSIAIGVSFLCSILEAVLLSITPSFVEEKIKSSPAAGKRIQKVKQNLDSSISSILILNTFAHTMGAAGVGSQALHVFGPEWETLIALLLTLAILYFSEIIPKTLGATFWRQLAVTASSIILILIKLVFPLVWISSQLTRLIGAGKKDNVSREEILAFAALGYKGGVLGNQENMLMNNILTLREVFVKDILTPRTVVHALEENTTVKEALDHPLSNHYSRLPIYQQDIDHITGVVLNRKMLEHERKEGGDCTLKELAEPIYRVSELLPVLKLLDLFIKRSEHIFLVEDEFGQTSGIVTLEDTIETLIGSEIVDESDVVEDLQQLAKSKYRERLRAKQHLIENNRE